MPNCNSMCEYFAEGTCEVNCQAKCQLNCQSNCEVHCMSTCQEMCECSVQACQSCQKKCEIHCMTSCEEMCQCSIQGCQNCQSSCQLACQCSVEGCQTPCQGSVQFPTLGNLLFTKYIPKIIHVGETVNIVGKWENAANVKIEIDGSGNYYHTGENFQQQIRISEKGMHKIKVYGTALEPHGNTEIQEFDVLVETNVDTYKRILINEEYSLSGIIEKPSRDRIIFDLFMERATGFIKDTYEKMLTTIFPKLLYFTEPLGYVLIAKDAIDVINDAQRQKLLADLGGEKMIIAHKNDSEFSHISPTGTTEVKVNKKCVFTYNTANNSEKLHCFCVEQVVMEIKTGTDIGSEGPIRINRLMLTEDYHRLFKRLKYGKGMDEKQFAISYDNDSNYSLDLLCGQKKLICMNNQNESCRIIMDR